MRILAGIFNRLQLFFFAFTLAASSMMVVGLASGKLERGEVYTGLAATLASHITSNPALMALIPGTVPTQVADDSLQALQQRQRQIVAGVGVSTGG